MPCTITGTLQGDELLDMRERLRAHQESTQLLCGLMRHLSAEKRVAAFGAVPGLKEWWRKHQETDARASKDGK